MQEYILLRPDHTHTDELYSYRAEFLASGDSMDGTGNLRKTEDMNEYIKHCADCENEETLPAGLVTATQFVMVRKSDERIVGMIQIRHYFNDYLKVYGGHIGYSVRPSERRKGYAKKMLKMALPVCREMGIKNILITCLADNVASEKTIIANGGVYESTVTEPNAGVELKRYWISID
ncbi:MAG: GNAT family N-acetyltransferase [Eubacteriaceae bacterium]|nr:GNAT family N-acetyltransferase [Eubacteriaceae bacterium]